jgi:hypothetical protein
MKIRLATLADAEAVAAIYAPIVLNTAISFETEPPTAEQMRRDREVAGAACWLVERRRAGAVDGYVYASAFRDRAAYRWSVETTAMFARTADRASASACTPAFLPSCAPRLPPGLRRHRAAERGERGLARGRSDSAPWAAIGTSASSWAPGTTSAGGSSSCGRPRFPT